jgi:hypothetical protein
MIQYVGPDLALDIAIGPMRKRRPINLHNQLELAKMSIGNSRSNLATLVLEFHIAIAKQAVLVQSQHNLLKVKVKQVLMQVFLNEMTCIDSDLNSLLKNLTVIFICSFSFSEYQS